MHVLRESNTNDLVGLDRNALKVIVHLGGFGSIKSFVRGKLKYNLKGAFSMSLSDY